MSTQWDPVWINKITNYFPNKLHPFFFSSPISRIFPHKMHWRKCKLSPACCWSELGNLALEQGVSNVTVVPAPDFHRCQQIGLSYVRGSIRQSRDILRSGLCFLCQKCVNLFQVWVLFFLGLYIIWKQAHRNQTLFTLTVAINKNHGIFYVKDAYRLQN